MLVLCADSAQWIIISIVSTISTDAILEQLYFCILGGLILLIVATIHFFVGWEGSMFGLGTGGVVHVPLLVQCRLFSIANVSIVSSIAPPPPPPLPLVSLLKVVPLENRLLLFLLGQISQFAQRISEHSLKLFWVMSSDIPMFSWS